jgi:hypothetical protein
MADYVDELEEDGLSQGAIIGIVVGIAAVYIILTIVACVISKKRTNQYFDVLLISLFVSPLWGILYIYTCQARNLNVNNSAKVKYHVISTNAKVKKQIGFV